MKAKFDPIVESDYSILYFHYGLNSKNKPSFSWLRKVYSSFDRKSVLFRGGGLELSPDTLPQHPRYKKNLKALYIIHATSFVKTVLTLLRPFISSKFAKKINFIHTLSELEQHVHLSQIAIPKVILEWVVG